MSMRDQRPLRRRVQSRVMRVVNVPMRRILGLPFATPLSGRLMLISYTGRKTGRRYRQPVSYVRHGQELLTPGGGRWTDNLRDGHPIRIHLRGRDVQASPEVVRDPDEVERLLAVMTEANPRVRSFVGIAQGPEGRLDRPQLDTAIRHGFRVVRWHLAEPPPSPLR